jgi:hypothetical protein
VLCTLQIVMCITLPAGTMRSYQRRKGLISKMDPASILKDVYGRGNQDIGIFHSAEYYSAAHAVCTSTRTGFAWISAMF